MNDGVRILLERMETNPEEFNGEVNKWGDLLQYYKAYLDPEDANALNEGINKLLQQRFTEKVMEELVDPKVILPRGGNPHFQHGTVGQTLATSLTTSKPWVTAGVLTSNNPTSTPTTTVSLEHLRAHVDALQREVANQKPKEHKTIFGKLFNYS